VKEKEVNEEQDVFEESMELQAHVADSYTIEPAVMVDRASRQACPGVFIELEDQHAPLFISSEQLRRMAVVADEEAEQVINFRPEG
jgi:alpha-D-ribose 1-methylphosphonate 5-triphosphate synthase subunit PhnH